MNARVEFALIVLGCVLLALKLLHYLQHVRTGWKAFKADQHVHPRGRIHEFIGFDLLSRTYCEVRPVDKEELERSGYRPSGDVVYLRNASVATNDREARRWEHYATRDSRWCCPR